HSDYAELEDKYAALAADNDKAMESLKQADAAVKLAHEKFSALAAENAELKQSEKEFNNFCRQEYYGWEDNFTETPATDAFLAEIERKAIRKFINSIEHILRDKLSPYDTEEMLESMRIFLEEQGGEQK
ncbi:hypothetical protein JGC23_25315, partial [Salmonella enterica subsp. enterica serovar Kentucky]|nr:hypothetical protein [Salmonella enterica subsp. enterica serovar Kentucky]